MSLDRYPFPRGSYLTIKTILGSEFDCHFLYYEPLVRYYHYLRDGQEEAIPADEVEQIELDSKRPQWWMPS